MELVNRVGQLNLEGWLGEFFLLVMSSLRSCFLISKNCSLCWVVTLTTGMCWGKSTSFWCVLGQSVCSWRPSKINLETDGSPGEATSEMTHIWPLKSWQTDSVYPSCLKKLNTPLGKIMFISYKTSNKWEKKRPQSTVWGWLWAFLFDNLV